MNDNELLAQQAAAIKQLNPASRVFTYRNLVKALPWFSVRVAESWRPDQKCCCEFVYPSLALACPPQEVRHILDDPAYSGFFLPFRPGGPSANNTHVPRCDINYDPPKCSEFYHDQCV